MNNNYINNNTSIKDYYVNLQKLYNDAVSLLRGINQSLSTQSSEISIKLLDGDDDSFEYVHIPSFLYLESKIEELSTNINEIINIPESGQAWLTQTDNLMKINMVKTNVAPPSPQIHNNNLQTYFKKNLKLKDFVNPYTYLKLNVSGIQPNISKLEVKKIVIHNSDLYEALSNRPLLYYEDYLKALETVDKNHYEEYDFELSLPTRTNKYSSMFKISEIPISTDHENPYVMNNDNNTVHQHMYYDIILDTIQYSINESPETKISLQKGDELTLHNSNNIYEIIDINRVSYNSDSYLLTIQEKIGHSALDTFENNNQMYFEKYETVYNSDSFVNIPIEEDQYIVVFIASKTDNIRSTWSNAILVDLNQVYMTNENGDLLRDENNARISYINYYNKFCNNIGDILQGIADIIYPQVNQYSIDTLNELQSEDSLELKSLIDSTLNDNIRVVSINEHQFSSEMEKNINYIAEQKNILAQEINNNYQEIERINTEITSLSNDSDGIISLRQQLQSLYELQKQKQQEYVQQINLLNDEKFKIGNLYENKYRLRGRLSTDPLEKFIELNYLKVDIIGTEVEYKYVSKNIDSIENIKVINGEVYSNWNKMISYDKEREINIKDGSIVVSYKANEELSDIKWNNIDIPISEYESVVVKVRFKYNIGQPFINVYSPWSEEHRFNFSDSNETTNNIDQIFHQNDSDFVVESIKKSLIDDGLIEHNNNKLQTADKLFFHNANDIYSGFMDSNSKYLSITDKINLLDNELTTYKEKFQLYDLDFDVYLVIDNIEYQLYRNSLTEIVLDNIVKSNNLQYKSIYIKVKNKSNNNLKLYSLFQGSPYEFLKYDSLYTNSGIGSYVDVPVFYEDDDELKNGEIEFQRYNQYIYFRNTDPFTNNIIYKINNSSNNFNNLDITLQDNLSVWMSKILQKYIPKYSVTIHFVDPSGVLFKDQNTFAPKSIVMEYNKFIVLPRIEDISEDIIDNLREDLVYYNYLITQTQTPSVTTFSTQPWIPEYNIQTPSITPTNSSTATCTQLLTPESNIQIPSITSTNYLNTTSTQPWTPGLTPTPDVNTPTVFTQNSIKVYLNDIYISNNILSIFNDDTQNRIRVCGYVNGAEYDITYLINNKHYTNFNISQDNIIYIQSTGTSVVEINYNNMTLALTVICFNYTNTQTPTPEPIPNSKYLPLIHSDIVIANILPIRGYPYLDISKSVPNDITIRKDYKGKIEYISLPITYIKYDTILLYDNGSYVFYDLDTNYTNPLYNRYVKSYKGYNRFYYNRYYISGWEDQNGNKIENNKIEYSTTNLNIDVYLKFEYEKVDCNDNYENINDKINQSKKSEQTKNLYNKIINLINNSQQEINAFELSQLGHEINRTELFIDEWKDSILSTNNLYVQENYKIKDKDNGNTFDIDNNLVSVKSFYNKYKSNYFSDAISYNLCSLNPKVTFRKDKEQLITQIQCDNYSNGYYFKQINPNSDLIIPMDLSYIICRDENKYRPLKSADSAITLNNKYKTMWFDLQPNKILDKNEIYTYGFKIILKNTLES